VKYVKRTINNNYEQKHCHDARMIKADRFRTFDSRYPLSRTVLVERERFS
jgi:hypothetical protein